ncbi:hypothetical protein CGI39_24745 [Vibrio parahaemolyticus]|nr:hypothetical protein CGI39_24745 [Vibrio parahaemolyticus]
MFIGIKVVSDPDRVRFMEHFPFNGDVTLQILKGHLLAEELVREIVRLQLPHSDALVGSKGASYDCHQMICLAEAIIPESDNMKWLWVALKKLNKLRNYLAHQLNDQAAIDHKVDDLVEYLRKHDDAFEKFVGEYNHDKTDTRLILCIMSMSTNLVALKKIIAD